MDSQHYNAHPSCAHYSYYPPPHHPQNPNQIISPPNTTPHPPGVDSYATLNSYYHHPTTHVAGYEAPAAVSYVDHHSSQEGALPTASYYQDTGVSQSWTAKEAIRQYGAAYLPHSGYTTAIDSLNNNSTYPNNLRSDPLANDAIQRIPKETKVLQSMRCEVCKIDCNSKDVLDRHMLGKKHKRNLLSQENTSKNFISPVIASMPKDKRETKKRHLSGELGRHVTMGSLVLAAGEDLETKRRKLLEDGAAVDSVIVCSMCNVVCNSQTVFNDHLAGKKHVAKAGMIPPSTVLPADPYPAIPPNTVLPADPYPAIPPNTVGPATPVPNFWTNSVVQPPVNKAKRKGLKKPKIVQSAWCEICSIDCNSQDVLTKHKMGKKHQKKLEKLNESKEIASTPASTSSQITNNPLIGPQENPSGNNGHIVGSRRAKIKLASAPEEGVETKRRKMLSGGAAAAAMRVCAICNVVCNSQTVFNYHLAGQKHLTMVKNQAEASCTATQVLNVV